MKKTIEMQEYKVGETFEYEGKKYVVRVGRVCDCLRCAFEEDDKACHKFRCTPSGRKDCNWVYFKEVKMKEIELGETFEYEGKKLVVKEGGGVDCCNRCAFACDLNGCREYSCCSDGRLDGNSVYFEEVKNG